MFPLTHRNIYTNQRKDRELVDKQKAQTIIINIFVEA